MAGFVDANGDVDRYDNIEWLILANELPAIMRMAQPAADLDNKETGGSSPIHAKPLAVDKVEWRRLNYC